MNIFGYKVDWRLILWVVLAIMIGHLVKGQMDGFTVKLDDGTKVYTGEHVSKCFTEKNQWPAPKYWQDMPVSADNKTADVFNAEWTTYQQKSNDRLKMCKDAWRSEKHSIATGHTEAGNTLKCYKMDKTGGKAKARADKRPCPSWADEKTICRSLADYGTCGKKISDLDTFGFLIGYDLSDSEREDKIGDVCESSCRSKKPQRCKAGGGHWRAKPGGSGQMECICYDGIGAPVGGKHHWHEDKGQCI